MKRLLAVALLAAAFLAGQPPQGAPSEMSSKEQEALDTALAEAGASPVEYLRAIEKHLQKYPDSPRKAELERAGARAAIEAGDSAKIILFGERVLARQPDDLTVIERVARALAAAGGDAAEERALKYAAHFEELVRGMQGSSPPPGVGPAEFQDQTNRALGRALTYQAHAARLLGKPEDALARAQRAFTTWASAEAAREVSRAFERLGKTDEAIRSLADAFTIPDPAVTDALRERDRARMGELLRTAKGSESGLGDVVLEAYDRNIALVHARELRARSLDPNANLSDPMEFTLTAVEGPKLSMATLKGKVLVLDFWATWCAPCRFQHPLYEKVKQQFKSNDAVVFLSIDADDDRAAVKPFLAELKWAGPVYFEDGLARALKISSMPTTLIIGRQGRIVNRMEGFDEERFVDMLTERIKDALRE
jgi:thiol-disulfide isomerase/thioredoxin